MSKVILVIDEMPNNCSECPCCNEDECGNQYKGYIGDYLEWNSGRPSWCPLKPMPEKKDVELNEKHFYFEDAIKYAVYKGYNKCIDKILEVEK